MLEFPFESSTFVDLVRRRAQDQPRRTAYIFLKDGEVEEARLTYAALDRWARRVAALLQLHLAPGSNVLLLLPPGLAYVTAVFGCLYAGVVAVPAYPPRGRRSLAQLRAIMADVGATVALTTGAIFKLAQKRFAEVPALAELRWLTTDGLSGAGAQRWRRPQTDGDDLALLQYTSGSTAAPKGVMLTQANLLHQAALLQRRLQTTQESVGVFWLPPYHDMGLIGGILQTAYCGGTSVLMAPFDFLQRPRRWLQAISRYQATISAAPNFAYDLCARQIPPAQRAGLDLSHWRLALNGAEPVRPETLRRFAAVFAPHGFRLEAFYPCYGLSEATLLVSGAEPAAPSPVRAFQRAALTAGRAVEPSAADPQPQWLAGCGRAAPDQELLIVDPATRTRCPAGRVGELWVSGPSVARGYWNRPEATAETFRAFLADTGAGPYLRTGDLGFILDGELFLIGRLKDMIISRGRNHFAEDLERTASACHPALEPYGCAAFSVEREGAERLVIVLEIVRRALRSLNMQAIVAAIRRAISTTHQLQPQAIVLVKPGSLPRTTSGKIQRYACRQRYLAGTLAGVGEWVLASQEAAADDLAAPVQGDKLIEQLATTAPPEGRRLVGQYLAGVIAGVLNGGQAGLIRPDQSLSALGFDSLAALALKNRLELDFGLVIPMNKFLETPDIGRLSDLLFDLLAQGRPETMAGRITPAEAERLLADLDRLSNEQVDALLDRLLAEEDEH